MCCNSLATALNPKQTKKQPAMLSFAECRPLSGSGLAWPSSMMTLHSYHKCMVHLHPDLCPLPHCLSALQSLFSNSLPKVSCPTMQGFAPVLLSKAILSRSLLLCTFCEKKTAFLRRASIAAAVSAAGYLLMFRMPHCSQEQ